MLKKALYVFLISMVPIIELRGAIPVGAALQMPWWLTFLVAVVGNLLPVPFILFFVEKVLQFMKAHRIFPRLVNWLEEKAQKGIHKVEKHALLGLMLFVAIPLPGTGAWTGSLVASLFHLDRRFSMISILCGVLVAGVLVTLISYGVLGFLSFLL